MYLFILSHRYLNSLSGPVCVKIRINTSDHPGGIIREQKLRTI